MLKNEYSDEALIRALREGGAARRKAWEYLYKNWSGAWVQVVCALGGNPDEAHEAFHEVAMPIQKVICRPEFSLKTASLKTYIVSCVKNRWLKNRRKQLDAPSNPAMETPELHDAVDNVEKEMILDDLRRTVNELLQILGERCRRVLRMFSQDYSMEEIAKAENWKDADKAKKEKYECQTKLKNHLRDNPDLRNYLKDLLNG